MSLWKLRCVEMNANSTFSTMTLCPKAKVTFTVTPTKVHRSRRSTSCSSSEASDDESRAKGTRRCHGHKRRHNKDDDGSGAAGGASNTTNNGSNSAAKTSGSSAEYTNTGGHNNRSGNEGHCDCDTGVDPSRLFCTLQKLALAPIRWVDNPKEAFVQNDLK